MTLETFEKPAEKPINKTVIILIIILVLSWAAMSYHYFVQMPKMAK